MADFSAARRMMVDGQIRTSDVTDLRIISAFLDVPREKFVASSKSALAYLDLDVPMTDSDAASARRLLKPMVLSKLLQNAKIRETDRVLVVGSGTGYAAAIASKLAASVVALEEDKGLSAQAARNLADLRLTGVETVTGPLTAGWPTGAPYDVILIDGAVEILPDALTRQLAEGGRLLCVRGKTPGKAFLYLSAAGEAGGRPVFDAAAPLLPGFAERPAFVF